MDPKQVDGEQLRAHMKADQAEKTQLAASKAKVKAKARTKAGWSIPQDYQGPMTSIQHDLGQFGVGPDTSWFQDQAHVSSHLVSATLDEVDLTTPEILAEVLDCGQSQVVSTGRPSLHGGQRLQIPQPVMQDLKLRRLIPVTLCSAAWDLGIHAAYALSICRIVCNALLGITPVSPQEQVKSRQCLYLHVGHMFQPDDSAAGTQSLWTELWSRATDAFGH